jgi:hypothetical protein
MTILYPELCIHLNDFMFNMDALVWQGTPDAVPPELVDEYRTSKSQPVLDVLFNALVQLDADMFRVDFQLAVEREEALMQAMQEIQNTLPPVYLAELEDEKKHMQFVIVSTAPLVDKKGPWWTMDTCKNTRQPQMLFNSVGSCPVFPIL